MIDLSQYRQASFRGIPFHVSTSHHRQSHRIDRKSYPFGSRGLVTDLGLDAPVIELSIFLLGDDALARRRDLEAALRVIGPGKLVHPTRGTIDVVVEQVNEDEDMTALGVADFTVTFVQSGNVVAPLVRVDTAANVITAASQTQNSVTDGYDFDLADATSPSQTDPEKLAKANQDLGRMAQSLTPGAITGSPANPAIPFTSVSAINASVLLVSEAFLIAENIRQYFGTTPEGAAAFLSILTENTGTLWAIANAASPQRGNMDTPVISPLSNRFMYRSYQPASAVAKNARLLAQALFDAIATIAARSLADTPFNSVQDALGARDTIVSALTHAAGSATTDDPQRATARSTALRGLRSAISRDISENITRLPWLERDTPKTSVPARVISYRLSGVVDDGLVKRNAIRHPSFVPAGEEILYLGGKTGA